MAADELAPKLRRKRAVTTSQMGVPSLRYQKAMGWLDQPVTERVRRSKGKEWHIYFVQALTLGFIKIGKTQDVGSRMRHLTVNSPDEVRLIGSALCTDGGRLEEELHSRFKHLRVRGEWFRPAPELLACIAEIAPTPGHSERQYHDRVVRPLLQEAADLRRAQRDANRP